jgi:nucleoside-triphosphatase THEP1
LNQVLIIHGEIASGKTRRGEQVSDRARVNGYKVRGILCKRAIRAGETIGYDMVDLESGDTTPMVYRETEVNGVDWKPLRGPFLYNEETFREANRLLTDAAYGMDARTLVVVDEYGHLEARGFGVYPGLRTVAESLGSGGKLMVLCRTDKIDDVIRVFAQNGVGILVMDTAQSDFMETLADSFI